jgi:hypothetical protein
VPTSRRVGKAPVYSGMRRLAGVALAVLLATPVVAEEWAGRARLDGHVTDARGVPLQGATITVEGLTHTGGPVVRTDAEGSWVVDGIAAGSWVVEVTAPGYRSQRIGVHLPHESAWLAPLDVQLQRPPVPPATGEARRAPEHAAEAPPIPPGEARSPGADLRASLEAGRIGRAHTLLASLGDEPPGDADTLVEMGTVFLDAGETADALVLFDRAVELDPTHVVGHYRRALGLLALGRTEDARAGFERVLGLSPEGPLAGKARQAVEELPTSTAAESP